MAKAKQPKPKAKASKATSWRKVEVDSDALRFSSMGGFFSLEELDGDAAGSIHWDAARFSAVQDAVPDDAPDDTPGSEPAPDAVPDDAAATKPARKRKRKAKQPTEEPPAEERLPWAPPHKKKAATERDATAADGPAAVEPAVAVREAGGEAAPSAQADVETEVETDMSAWSQLGLHPELLARLAGRGFTRPTPIQEACLPPALHGRRDIVGAAETGSGKVKANPNPNPTLTITLTL